MCIAVLAQRLLQAGCPAPDLLLHIAWVVEKSRPFEPVDQALASIQLTRRMHWTLYSFKAE